MRSRFKLTILSALVVLLAVPPAAAIGLTGASSAPDLGLPPPEELLDDVGNDLSLGPPLPDRRQRTASPGCPRHDHHDQGLHRNPELEHLG